MEREVPTDENRWGAMPDKPAIIKQRETIRRTGLSRSQIFRLEKDGLFPARVKLIENGSLVGHYEHEVHAWIVGRVRAGGRRMPAGCRGAKPKRQRVRFYE
jgi:predicted DNA-binding transcriptional regulator AlpA